MLFSFVLSLFLSLGTLFAPDDGAGGSGGDQGNDPPPDPNPDPPPAKSFSEKEVNAREAQLRRRYDREIKELKQEREKQQQALTELKEELTQIHGNTPNGNGDDPLDGDGRLKLLEQRFKRSEEELNKRIQEAEKKADDERQTRLNMERAQSLDKALEKADCKSKNMEMARRFFREQIVWDDVDSDWAFKLRTGELVPLPEGIDAELPDEWKVPKNQGGAGTTGGVTTSSTRRQHALQQEEAKLKELKQACNMNPHDRSKLVAFTQQKRKVQALREGLGVSMTT